MCWRLLTIGIMTVMAHGADVTGPSKFYVVSRFFSDNGALFYYRVIDVRPEGTGSSVRYIRVAPTNVYCPRMIVQATRATVQDKRPTEIVRHNNPCAIRPRDLDAALRKYKRTMGVFETISFGIVAQCGSSSVTLELPMLERVDLDRMKAARPDIARLWDLTSDITTPIFGDKDTFHDRTEEEDLSLQHGGEEMVPELTSGQYDPGLIAAVKGNVGTWRSPSFRSLLADYRGPISATQAKAAYIPQLLNAQAYAFVVYAAPKYPPLALQARIQGKVELQLAVRPATGEVYSVSAVSGHPLLKPSAADAAKQWHFDPSSLKAEPVNVTLEFALRCQ